MDAGDAAGLPGSSEGADLPDGIDALLALDDSLFLDEPEDAEDLDDGAWDELKDLDDDMLETAELQDAIRAVNKTMSKPKPKGREWKDIQASPLYFWSHAFLATPQM